MHVCVFIYIYIYIYIYIINIHSAHSYIMHTKTFISDVINRCPSLKILCNIINVFTVIFDQFNAFLLNKSVNISDKSLLPVLL